MAVVENRFVCDLSKPVQAQALKGNVFSLDNLGSRLSVLIYNNGQPATISGSVTADCILPDGSTVTVNGGLTTENGGSKAYVDVPQSCLLIPGILKIAIKCTSSSVITTLAAIVANVYMTKTDNVITPSQQLINDWNAEISAYLATIGTVPSGKTVVGMINEEATARENADAELKSALNVSNQLNYSNLDAQITPGKNLSNPKRFVNGYRITSVGDVVSDSTASTLSLSDYIFIKANTNYALSINNGTFLTVAKYDELFRFINTTTIGAADIRSGKVINYEADSYIRVFGIIAEMQILQIEQASAKTDFEKYSPRLNNDVAIGGVTKKTVYLLPFIYNQKCCCNKVTNSLTAYYAGVDLGETVNRIYANFIFEDSSKVTGGVGTVALILNANGVKKISNITDLSIHCTITQTLLKVDIFGDRYGTRYYQNLINQSINLAADGETEHTVLIYAKLASGIVTVTLDGNDYNGTFTPTSDIASLSDVVGNYATFEHFCNGNRDNIAMPMFTYFAVQNVAGYMLLKDYFDRQDGQLSTAPNGIVYSLMNNGNYSN